MRNSDWFLAFLRSARSSEHLSPGRWYATFDRAVHARLRTATAARAADGTGRVVDQEASVEQARDVRGRST